MKICGKCGFENDANETVDCPKCGAIYAKVEKAKLNASTVRQQEETISQKIEKEMGSSYVPDENLYLWEQEARQDRDAYPFIAGLSTFFVFAALLTGVSCIIGAYHFWDILTQLQFFSDRGKIFLFVAIALTDAVSVGTLLAISATLTLGRDIANNTRASREYLLKLATAKLK
ncbi:MAG: hypothetical protein A2X84_12345 [Desulfuromonadaceae bacterium GWC2_58_13]|nr:MAG: hypothetical protein A2X84_12345 [Desulfuromonadaceae bacterium GWC2_58_13]